MFRNINDSIDSAGWLNDNPWVIERGDGPLVAAAIHHGHFARAEVEALFAVSADARLREEDPYTGAWTDVASTGILGLRSRFEFDLNRPPEKTVYLHPDDAWGIQVWKPDLPAQVVVDSKALYAAFYREMFDLLEELIGRYGRVVILDLHSYNHRRQGPDAPVADPQENPQINVGTETMDRQRWAAVVDCFIERMRTFDCADVFAKRLDVRENVKFRGGHFSHWIHQTFPTTACAIAIEVKKFFMDEWTGELYAEQFQAVRAALLSAADGVLAELGKS